MKNEHMLNYLLAGETDDSVRFRYDLSNNMIKQYSLTNLAVYSFYELYASGYSLVYYLKDYSNNFFENTDEIAALAFVYEIALLQNTALVRTNNRIKDLLNISKSASTKHILDLQMEFGKQ